MSQNKKISKFLQKWFEYLPLEKKMAAMLSFNETFAPAALDAFEKAFAEYAKKTE